MFGNLQLDDRPLTHFPLSRKYPAPQVVHTSTEVQTPHPGLQSTVWLFKISIPVVVGYIFKALSNSPKSLLTKATKFGSNL